MILFKMVNEIKKCRYCMDEIKGGTFIEGKKKVYLCSGECLDAYEKERGKK